MSLLYLTPVIPLGPLSYVMGTTSMPLMSFAKAKIAALPLTVLYVYLGAATGTLVASAEEEENILDPSGGGSISSSGKASVSTAKKGMSELKVDPKLIVFGILFSIVSIAVISIKMKQELQKVCEYAIHFCSDCISSTLNHESFMFLNILTRKKSRFWTNKTMIKILFMLDMMII